MPLKVADAMKLMEEIAPPKFAEEWDNIGLQLGDPAQKADNIMVALDVNEAVADEAISLGIDLIISHHPLIFQPLKTLRSDRVTGSLIAKLIKHDIAVYAAHTNLDSAAGGVNDCLAGLFQMKNIRVIAPCVREKYLKLVVYVPGDHLELVREAICRAGAGMIGNYAHCTFGVSGVGTFLPLEGTDPFIGTQGVLEKVEEVRLETIVPEGKLQAVAAAMRQAHPYEEVAYDLFALELPGPEYGLGRIGEIDPSLTLEELAEKAKKILQVDLIKVTGDKNRKITRVAICGGSGASLIKDSYQMGAQCLITGDVKYHEAQEAQGLGLALIDGGHYGTEAVIVAKLTEALQEKIAARKIKASVRASKTNTDPWWNHCG